MSSFFDSAVNVIIRTGIVDSALDVLSPQHVFAKEEMRKKARELQEACNKTNSVALPFFIASFLLTLSSRLSVLGLLGTLGSGGILFISLTEKQMGANLEKMVDKITTYYEVHGDRIRMNEEAYLHDLTQGCFFQEQVKEIYRPQIHQWNARILNFRP